MTNYTTTTWGFEPVLLKKATFKSLNFYIQEEDDRTNLSITDISEIAYGALCSSDALSIANGKD